MGLGGRDVTNYLLQLLLRSGYLFTTISEKQAIQQLKEALSYVALDYEQELKKAETSTDCQRVYTLPDGQTITVGSERFRCAEALFKPYWAGPDREGVHMLIYQSLMKCEDELRGVLSKNIVLAGGNTMFGGIAERMLNEVTTLIPVSLTCHVDALPDKHSIWMGGSILASLKSFENMMININEYYEYGPSIVHRKKG
ncbi:hypothetical protein RFI_05270 [Reticulomyxa filosa]|uniref:Actin n=1 Tax=Reticulomyxa filosa TaxID=46433 RepID=X6P141_RETFI|nr:hypothetical protein RFI_05270 [Reticulomyxa filosa]|eukprot:ETO31848.1 hypothetical protein RFI_05270 [Reticulomyxa filosa]